MAFGCLQRHARSACDTWRAIFAAPVFAIWLLGDLDNREIIALLQSCSLVAVWRIPVFRKRLIIQIIFAARFGRNLVLLLFLPEQEDCCSLEPMPGPA